MKRARVVLLAVLLLAPAACEKVHRDVADSVSPCFRVLPQARAAVTSGEFLSVARLRGDRITRFFPDAPATPPPGDIRDVCVVAYRGTFDQTSVPHLVGTHHRGSVALVFVGVRSQRVQAVVLADALPPPLHRH
jgi:hypothetical protein